MTSQAHTGLCHTTAALVPPEHFPGGCSRWDDEGQMHRHQLGIARGCWVRELPLPCHCPCASLVLGGGWKNTPSPA